MQVSEVMIRDVVSVQPGATVREVARLLIDKGISGAPVVDAEGRLLGMVTEGDLIRRTELGTEYRRSRWLEYFIGPEVAAEEFVKSHAVSVADVMTPHPVSVSEDADLKTVAELMERKHVKRLPVVRDGKVVGIVSRSNLVQAVASLPPTPGERQVSNRELRERVDQAIRSQPFGMPWLLSAVVVEDGIVDLWGQASSQAERRAVRVAVESVPGVRQVRDNLTVWRPSFAAE